MSVKTFGPVDARSLEQLERCMQAGDAEFGVLCADHHPGYSQPIGGGIAYEGYVSPSGVGYDIGCIGAGAAITTMDGFTRPIERITSTDAVACLHEGRTRAVAPHWGAVAQGMKPVLDLRLVDGRSLRLTADHRVWTKGGWAAVGELDVGDVILCAPTVGLPHEPCDLAPALLRIVAYVSGDGHLSRDGKRTSIYTTVEADAEALIQDLAALGYTARVARRGRAPGRRDEIRVYVGSVRLHRELAALGSPVGKKRWPTKPMRWLFETPAWARAQFLSAFACAEMTTPCVVERRIASHVIKQADANSARLVVELLTSLDFRASLMRIAGQWVIQVLGGEAEQVRFIEQVGFCRAAEKRVAAARALSIAAQRCAVLERRAAAQTEVEIRYAAGERVRDIAVAVAAQYDVPLGFVHHSIYSPRSLRRGLNVSLQPHSEGEGAWIPVAALTPRRAMRVWDVVTADPAESFLANGIVVHNCGNKAARTDLTRADLDALGGVERVMNEITRRISFGMGVPAQERVDHPVLDKIRKADFAPQRKLSQLAESQLGTVGSGNHYVNVMEDEEGHIWVGVHFGSRGFGHKTASGFLAMAQGLAFDGHAREGEMDSPPVLFEVDSELGESYISAMNLALEYAYAGRDAVVDKVLEILGAEATHEVHNNHNDAVLEEHFGRKYWVVRKGCTPARPGQEGFVGGSMGDESVILEGVDSTDSAEALFSTVHGAGRVMSRSQAAGRLRYARVWACTMRDCEYYEDARESDGGTCPIHGKPLKKMRRQIQVKPGLVDWPAVQARLREQGIVLVGGGADEAPEVYKRLPEVLAAHGDTIRVKHTLRPLGVAMAGRDVKDPYKD